MRENAKIGRTFLRFFEKFSKLLVFNWLQGKKFTVTEQKSFSKNPYAVEAALIVRDLDISPADDHKHNRTVGIEKARSGRGTGCRLAFEFELGSLKLKELGLITKESR